MAIGIFIGRDEKDRANSSYFIKTVPEILHSFDPGLDLRIYPQLGNYNDIEFALAWNAPFGIFEQLPQLRCIASLGAGVDHLFADPKLPRDIPIVRIVDPVMSTEITQYVVAAVLFYLKRFDAWEYFQAKKIWGLEPPFHLMDRTVGIMGLGFLGKNAAETLHNLGVKVIGWSNSPKNLPGIPSFTGLPELKTFLSKSEVLVCMLPLTPATRNILNAENLALLPYGAFLINLARGAHIVDADLIAALNSGQLSGARLDVFVEEPLRDDHPFWIHPKIRITPHIASVTNLTTALPQILNNYQRVMAGLTPLNTVDPQRAY